jgi:K+-transporting ATPase ATPase A chain
MTTAGWLQLLVFLGLIVAFTPLLGGYMAKVWAGGRAPGDRVFGPVERGIYRVCGIDPESEQRWTTYAFSLLAFSAVSLLFVYGFQRLQTSRGTRPPASSRTRTGRATAASRP